MEAEDKYIKGCRVNSDGCYPVFKLPKHAEWHAFTLPAHISAFPILECYYCNKEFTCKFIPKESIQYVWYNANVNEITVLDYGLHTLYITYHKQYVVYLGEL